MYRTIPLAPLLLTLKTCSRARASVMGRLHENARSEAGAAAKGCIHIWAARLMIYSTLPRDAGAGSTSTASSPRLGEEGLIFGAS